MEKIGKIIECDRPGCGETYFCKLESTGQTDGGYTKYHVYEEPPTEWGKIEYPLDGQPRMINLCPRCGEDYARAFKTFWKPRDREER